MNHVLNIKRTETLTPSEHLDHCGIFSTTWHVNMLDKFLLNLNLTVIRHIFWNTLSLCPGPVVITRVHSLSLCFLIHIIYDMVLWICQMRKHTKLGFQPVSSHHQSEANHVYVSSEIDFGLLFWGFLETFEVFLKGKRFSPLHTQTQPSTHLSISISHADYGMVRPLPAQGSWGFRKMKSSCSPLP